MPTAPPAPAPPSASAPRRRGGQRGQAAAELVAVLPVVVLLAVACWVVVRAAHEWVVAGSAARAGARAQEVGSPPEDAAHRVLGAARAGRARVRLDTTRDGTPRVRVTVGSRGARWAPAPPVTGPPAHAGAGTVP